jgi:ferredoxin
MDSRTPKPYLSDSCEQCGTCLTLCPVMRLEPAEAKREIANLREGRPSRVLKECTTCLDCDFFCPNGCNPGELIINRFGEVVRERGLPERARFFMPHSPVNFRTFVLDGMTPREKEIVESWRDMSPADEVCYPGCNMIATPLMTQTSALDGLDIRGGLEFCCGEMYWRMGMFDKLEEVARKTQAYFDELGASKVTILCSAGYYMFTEVLPHFGADYKFEMVSYLEVLDRKLEAGELKIRGGLQPVQRLQSTAPRPVHREGDAGSGSHGRGRDRYLLLGLPSDVLDGKARLPVRSACLSCTRAARDGFGRDAREVARQVREEDARRDAAQTGAGPAIASQVQVIRDRYRRLARPHG